MADLATGKPIDPFAQMDFGRQFYSVPRQTGRLVGIAFSRLASPERRQTV